MRKAATLVLLITFIIFIIVFGIMGLKILDDNYEIFTEACIGAVCLGVIFVCILIRTLGNKCPHCGKPILTNGEYCTYCGKKIKEK